MPRIIGIGHSHLVCFDEAAEDLLKDAPARFEYVPICFLRREYHPHLVLKDGVHWPNPVWVEALGREASGPNVSILLAMPGAEWWQWSLTPGPEPFDFIDPRADDGQPVRGQLVSYDLVLNKARTSVHYVTRIIEGIRSVTDAPIYLSPPPPPMRDIGAVFDTYLNNAQQRGQKHAGLRHVLKGLTPTIEQYGFSTEWFRLKAWRVAMHAVQEFCADTGVTYLPPPSGGVDEAGFLRPEMISDLVHANRIWAGMQLERVLMTERQPQEAL